MSDFEAHARKVLSKKSWDYYASGANDEQTLRDNTEAFRRYLNAYIRHYRPSFEHWVFPTGIGFDPAC